MSDMLQMKDDVFYLKAQAYLVTKPEDFPREFASDFEAVDLNPSFLWIAGRYVQANNTNKKGHHWTTEDLEYGENTIKYVPLNIEHDTERPIGVFVETKLIEREQASVKVPEIQALALMWGATFPALAQKVRAAHDAKQLFFSMECVSEKKQCLTCEQEFPYIASAHEVCEHLGIDPRAPRRFINPIFVGGALTSSPAWPDAQITDLASDAALEDSRAWEETMALVMASVTR
jgi:hypothetical protein